MQAIRGKYGRITRAICLVFALHILNMSIDPKDPEPDSVPEDLAVNDIESITEFVAEVLLGLRNAFPEHEEHDPKDAGAIDFCKIFFLTSQAAYPVSVPFISLRKRFFDGPEKQYAPLAPDVVAPPPKS